MSQFDVTVTNLTRSSGIGPVRVEADTKEDVGEPFLREIDETEETLRESGLTEWVINRVANT